MKLVYICSPLRGNIEENIKKADQYCAYAAQQGEIPLAPHTIFTRFLDDTIPEQREKGLTMGIELLRRCNEMWVCGDIISQGMHNEIEFAKQQSIPTKNISEAKITQEIRKANKQVEANMLKEKIREIQQHNPIFYTRNEEGRTISVIFPEEASDVLTPEEMTKAEELIMNISNKAFEAEPTEKQSDALEISQ